MIMKTFEQLKQFATLHKYKIYKILCGEKFNYGWYNKKNNECLCICETIQEIFEDICVDIQFKKDQKLGEI